MSQLPPDKITLEDLLRLKRAERPRAEFWAQFDQELHAKQLAALVEKKPRWDSAFRRLVRFSSFPLGAVAALALAFIVIREYRPPATEATPAIQPVVASARAIQPRIKSATVQVSAAPLRQSPVAQVQDKISAARPVPAVTGSAAVAPVASTAGQMSATIPWAADGFQSADVAVPAAHSLTVGLALAQLTRLSDSAPLPAGLESIAGGKMRPVADPLAQVAAPVETRHARILAALTDTRLVSAVEPASSSHTRERLANRLASEGFAADDISRLGVEGTQVSFKF